eukprot:m.1414267 g.1414267  ORF g.1414267 m.1414267 type:complete len:59 (+) comp25029_c0_seq9:2667-2843(+)
MCTFSRVHPITHLLMRLTNMYTPDHCATQIDLKRQARLYALHPVVSWNLACTKQREIE